MISLRILGTSARKKRPATPRTPPKRPAPTPLLFWEVGVSFFWFVICGLWFVVVWEGWGGRWSDWGWLVSWGCGFCGDYVLWKVSVCCVFRTCASRYGTARPRNKPTDFRESFHGRIILSFFLCFFLHIPRHPGFCAMLGGKRKRNLQSHERARIHTVEVASDLISTPHEAHR